MAAYINSLQLEKLVKELDLNTDNLFGIKSVINFIIDKYKQLLLFLLVFIIIYVVDHITYYNALFYGMATGVPGLPQPEQPQQIKSNTFKKKARKLKK